MHSSRFSIDMNDVYQVNSKVEARVIPATAIQNNLLRPTNETMRSNVWKCIMCKQSETSESLLCVSLWKTNDRRVLSSITIKVAVKSIRIRGPSHSAPVATAKVNKSILRQANNWIRLCHDNILRLEGVTISEWSGPLYAIVSPWVENGSLDNYLKQVDLSTDRKFKILREVASGLQYLHNNGVYNDLTPASILIGSDEKPYLRAFGVWMISVESDVTTFGSERGDRYRWMACERLRPQGGKAVPPSKATEVYSYGCIMMLLLSGHEPYHQVTAPVKVMVARLRGPEPFSQFIGLDDDLKQFAQKCLLKSELRPSLSSIVELLTWRINVSETMKVLLSKLPVIQIPKAALFICDNNDRGNLSKCNWSRGLGVIVPVAVKTLDVGGQNHIDKIYDRIRREVHVRQNLKHETVLDLYGMTTGFEILPSFVYPWMERGSLHEYLEREFSGLSAPQKLDILHQVADGVVYLHDNDVVHGNLTGDNVLLDGEGRVRITDFSRSAILGDAGHWKWGEQLPGAARYISPESVVRDEQTKLPQPTKVQDVYSYGCIGILVLSGKVPYWWIDEESEVLSEKAKGIEPFQLTAEIDPVHLDLVRCCLSVPVESRPSIQKVLYLFLVHHFGAVDLTNSVTRLNENHQAGGGYTNVHKCNFDLTSIDASVRKAVSRYTSMSTSIEIAVKAIFPVKDMLKIINRLFREIELWLKLEHENIVPLWGVADGFGSFPALVSPWIENGTLTGYVQREHETLSYSRKLALLRDIARGLQYLHSQSIVYGDLSGDNILVDRNGQASITYFGFSALFPETINEALLPTNPRCAAPYIAPEYLKVDDEGNGSPEFSTASDVYSFGGIILLVLEGKVPYHYIPRFETTIQYVLRGITPKRLPTCVVNDTVWAFIKRCWSEDVESRPSVADILEFVESQSGEARTRTGKGLSLGSKDSINYGSYLERERD